MVKLEMCCFVKLFLCASPLPSDPEKQPCTGFDCIMCPVLNFTNYLGNRVMPVKTGIHRRQQVDSCLRPAKYPT